MHDMLFSEKCSTTAHTPVDEVFKRRRSEICQAVLAERVVHELHLRRLTVG